jgi:hypothetical protein
LLWCAVSQALSLQGTIAELYQVIREMEQRQDHVAGSIFSIP